MQNHLQDRDRHRVNWPACDTHLLHQVALSRRHVELKDVEVLARLAFPLFLIHADIIIAAPTYGQVAYVAGERNAGLCREKPVNEMQIWYGFGLQTAVALRLSKCRQNEQGAVVIKRENTAFFCNALD